MSGFQRRVFALALALGPAAAAWAAPEKKIAQAQEPADGGPAREDEAAPGEEREPRPAERGAGFFKLLDERLGLSEEQRTKIKAVLDADKTELQELHRRMTELQDKKKAAFRRRNEKIRALLDEDQKEKFDDINADIRRKAEEREQSERRRDDDGPRRRPGPPEDDERRPGLRGQDRGDGRDLPPPEMWQDQAPQKQEEPQEPEEKKEGD